MFRQNSYWVSGLAFNWRYKRATWIIINSSFLERGKRISSLTESAWRLGIYRTSNKSGRFVLKANGTLIWMICFQAHLWSWAFASHFNCRFSTSISIPFKLHRIAVHWLEHIALLSAFVAEVRKSENNYNWNRFKCCGGFDRLSPQKFADFLQPQPLCWFSFRQESHSLSLPSITK